MAPKALGDIAENSSLDCRLNIGDYKLPYPSIVIQTIPELFSTIGNVHSGSLELRKRAPEQFENYGLASYDNQFEMKVDYDSKAIDADWIGILNGTMLARKNSNPIWTHVSLFICGMQEMNTQVKQGA